MIAARNLVADMYREKNAETAAAAYVRRRQANGEIVERAEVEAWLREHHPGFEHVAMEAMRRVARARRKRRPS
jgi:hypothetical protein